MGEGGTKLTPACGCHAGGAIGWEGPGMKNMDCFVETIYITYRKLKYFHYYWGYILGLWVDPYLIERPNSSRVPVGVPPMTEGEQQDMIVGEWGEGNETSPHMVEDIDLYHR
jgi:hypothetical protein